MEQHNCKLSSRSRTFVLNLIIDAGLFTGLRRKIAKWFMISEDHPLCPTYYRSKSARRSQEVKHLTRYFPPIIHPFSKLDLYWELFMSLVYATIILLVTLVSGEQIVLNRYYIRRVRLALDFVYIVDMIKIFFTGYYDKKRRRTVMRKFKIAKRYLKSFFIVDLVCLSYCIITIIRSVTGQNGINENYYTELEQFCVYLRILRIGRWRHDLKLYFIYRRFKNLSSIILRTILTYTLSIAITLALIIDAENYIDRIYNPSYKPNRYLSEKMSYYSAIGVLSLVYAGINPFDVPLKKLTTVFFIWIGFCLQGLLHVHIMRNWSRYMHIRHKKQGLLQQFSEFMRYKGLPVALRQKIYSFFSFKYQTQFYNETKIKKTVSKILRQDILLYLTQRHIERVHFFQNIPKAVLRKVVSQLKSEVYLTDDVIISAGETGDRMYFIYFGTVAIYSTNGFELGHLEDGAHFGEIALIFNEVHTTTAVAVTPCELFTLNTSDFQDILINYPKLKADIWKVATNSILYRGSGSFTEENTIVMRNYDNISINIEENDTSFVETIP